MSFTFRAPLPNSLMLHTRRQRIVGDKSQRSFLHMAVENDKFLFAKILLEQKTDVNCQDGKGNTALHIACSMGKLDFVRIIIRSGRCKLLLLNELNESALDLAIKTKHYRIVHLLLINGAKPVSTTAELQPKLCTSSTHLRAESEVGDLNECALGSVASLRNDVSSEHSIADLLSLALSVWNDSNFSDPRQAGRTFEKSLYARLLRKNVKVHNSSSIKMYIPNELWSCIIDFLVSE